MITISDVGEGPVHSAVVGQEAEAKENFGLNLDVNQFLLSSIFWDALAPELWIQNSWRHLP